MVTALRLLWLRYQWFQKMSTTKCFVKKQVVQMFLDPVFTCGLFQSTTLFPAELFRPEFFLAGHQPAI